jgi:hypothetical protein
MNFDKLTQQQMKGILLEMKKKGNGSKEIDARSMVTQMKNRILSVISAGEE